MQITSEQLAPELEAWANRDGWDSVTAQITQQYVAYSVGSMLESLECPNALHNNKQRIQRAFRNDSERYQLRAAALTPVILAAMPTERRARLSTANSVSYAVAMLVKECSDVSQIVLLGGSADEIQREVNEAVKALLAIPVTVQSQGMTK